MTSGKNNGSTSNNKSDDTQANDKGKIAQLLKEKDSVAIVLPIQSTIDATAAGLGLFAVLKDMGKNVTIVSPKDPKQPQTQDQNNDAQLPLQKHITQHISADGDTLMITLPFEGDGIENINYKVEEDHLNILVEPEKTSGRLNPDDVTFTYTGGKPNVIVAIYTPTLESLGELYEKQNDHFADAQIVNIDRHFTNSIYGDLNYVDKKSPAVSQMVNDILRDMRANVNEDAATLLYTGIAAATNNFSSHTVDSNTFRSAAFFLDKGADKSILKQVSAGQGRMAGVPAGMSSGAGMARMQRGGFPGSGVGGGRLGQMFGQMPGQPRGRQSGEDSRGGEQAPQRPTQQQPSKQQESRMQQSAQQGSSAQNRDADKGSKSGQPSQSGQESSPSNAAKATQNLKPQIFKGGRKNSSQDTAKSQDSDKGDANSTSQGQSQGGNPSRKG